MLTNYTGLVFIHISCAVADTSVPPIGVGAQGRIDTHCLLGLTLIQIWLQRSFHYTWKKVKNRFTSITLKRIAS